MTRKPAQRLTDQQNWAIVTAPANQSSAALARELGAEYFTVHSARKRFAESGWSTSIAYVKCGGCREVMIVPKQSLRLTDTRYHPACKRKVANMRRRAARAEGNVPKSTPYVNAWREKNPEQSRVLRIRAREAAKRRRTPFDIADSLEKIRDYDEETYQRSVLRAVRNTLRWSDHEDEFLWDRIDQPAADLAEEMGRTLWSIRARKVHLRRTYREKKL